VSNWFLSWELVSLGSFCVRGGVILSLEIDLSEVTGEMGVDSGRLGVLSFF